MSALSSVRLGRRLLGAGAGLLLAGAIPITAMGTPPETPTATPGSATTAPVPGGRPATAPVPANPPRTGSTAPATDPTRAEAGVPGSTTVATDAPPVPGLPARERAQATKTLTELHKVNGLEIALGRLAQDKGQSPAIKEYAQQLITDHESADKKVLDFATAHDLGLAAAPLPREPGAATTDTGLRRPAAVPGTPGTSTTPGGSAGTAVAGTSAPGAATGSVSDQSPVVPALDPEGQRMVSRLEKLEGTRFDKQFLTEMVRGHQKTLSKIKAAERHAKSPPLQTLLQEIRTSVEAHLEKARDIQKGGAS